MELNKEIIERFLQNSTTENENRLVETWYNSFEKKYNGFDNLPENEQISLENELYLRIKQQISSNTSVFKVVPSVNHKKWYLSAVAAGIVLVLGTYFLFFTPKNTELTTHIMDKGFIEKINETTKKLTFELEDGSKITLEPNSKVNFPEHFRNDEREVFLTGEAFFDIAKNPEKPFLVHSNKIITKVLGTSFWIRPVENSKIIKVEVVSGKVSVYEQTANLKNEKLTNSGNGVILTPNQKVTYFDENSYFVTGIVEKPLVVAPKTTKTSINFIFDDAPLSEVLKKLEDSYGLEIVLEKEIMNNCPLTANLEGLPFFTKLDLVCEALHANYEVKGTNILISGEGCE